MKYRPDIDGLRAIAVIAVFLFHVGYLPKGFLGVDVFFVISGYLITTILLKEITTDSFSYRNFYYRRARRILPLTSVTVAASLAVGYFSMLPDDLENLGQSAVATVFFSNNILQAMTTGNYWDVVNEYKPLMHTWSLAVEEQFYFIYPFLIVLLAKRKPCLQVAVFLTLAACSLVFQNATHADQWGFYSMPARFWELGLGGTVAVLQTDRKFCVPNALRDLSLCFLLTCFFISLPWNDNNSSLILAVVSACIIVSSPRPQTSLAISILSLKPMVYLGLLSFGIYMWHQPVLAFSRYFLVEHLGAKEVLFSSIAVLALAAVSYYLIEQPFRDQKKLTNRLALTVISASSLLLVICGLYVNHQRGVVRDVPSLELIKNDRKFVGHSQFNSAVHSRNVNFTDSDSLKILVIGDSFARDWVNVLDAAALTDPLELTYAPIRPLTRSIQDRISDADIVFFAVAKGMLPQEIDAPVEKTILVGTKNFGACMGYFYNRPYLDAGLARTTVLQEFMDRRSTELRCWNGLYIDTLGSLLDTAQRVPVYTTDGLFISQDCRHLTQAGAKYLAGILREEIQIAISKILETQTGESTPLSH